MAFRDYNSIAAVQQRYQIVYQDAEFITPLPVTPSAAFLTDYDFTQKYINVLSSETSRCESIIFPVLKDVFRHYAEHLALWSHPSLTADEELTGIPDYIIASRSPFGKTVMGQPLLVIVEAKKNDFEQGWGQCLAGMVAAQRLNNLPQTPIYGIVTDGQLWQFGRLLDDNFTMEKSSATTDKLENLFALVNALSAVRWMYWLSQPNPSRDLSRCIGGAALDHLSSLTSWSWCTSDHLPRIPTSPPSSP